MYIYIYYIYIHTYTYAYVYMYICSKTKAYIIDMHVGIARVIQAIERSGHREGDPSQLKVTYRKPVEA